MLWSDDIAIICYIPFLFSIIQLFMFKEFRTETKFIKKHLANKLF